MQDEEVSLGWLSDDEHFQAIFERAQILLATPRKVGDEVSEEEEDDDELLENVEDEGPAVKRRKKSGKIEENRKICEKLFNFDENSVWKF